VQAAARRRRESDREIDGVATKIHDLAGGAEHQVDARGSLAEAVQARQQPAVRECCERGDGEQAIGAFGPQPRRGFTQQIESRGQLRKIIASLIGEHQAAGQALEEDRVEILLEASHLLADRRGGYAQLDGGRHEAAEPRGGFECTQGVEGRETSGHARARIT
jgi:hypothetical protein